MLNITQIPDEEFSILVEDVERNQLLPSSQPETKTEHMPLKEIHENDSLIAGNFTHDK